MSLRTELRDELCALTQEENREAQNLLKSASEEYMADLMRRIDANRQGMLVDPTFDAGVLIGEVRDNGCR
jgi:hypothetical protein